MFLFVSFKCVVVFKHWRGVGFAFVEVLLAEGDAYFISSVGHEDKAGYSRGWFVADDAGLPTFLVWTFNGGRRDCGWGLWECETHGFASLFEEVFVSEVVADLYEAVFLAKVQDAV